MTCFGFLCTCRERRELNLAFRKGKGNVSPADRAALGTVCSVRCCHPELQPLHTTFSLQTSGVESTFIVVGFILKLIFCKTLGKKYFAIASSKI